MFNVDSNFNVSYAAAAVDAQRLWIATMEEKHGLSIELLEQSLFNYSWNEPFFRVQLRHGLRPPFRPE